MTRRSMLRTAASVFFSSLLHTVIVTAVEIRVASFNIGAHYGESYFDYSLGDPGTPDHESVRAILARINADVVALQEIHSADLTGSPDDLQALATALGYSHVFEPPVTNVFDTSLRVVCLSRFPFLTTDTVHSPAGAKDMTRLQPVVRVDVPGTNNDPLLVSVHLKSSTEPSDRFQRAVEMKRLTGYLSGAGLTNAHNFIVLGDFNPSSTNTTFSELPASGLPASFVLGSDITFPVTYSTDPLVYFSTPAAFRLNPRQLDGSASTFGTTSPGGPTLDLFLISPAIAGRPIATEIYNSTLDASNTAGLPKAGTPLDSSTSATASDHFAVFADLELDSAGPYVFKAPGQTVTEDFSGFGGGVDPDPWSTSGGSGWHGIDDGSSATAGWRVYGSGPGFLTDGAAAGVMTAVFENQSSVPITALEVALDAGQWRAVTGGAADQLKADLWIAGLHISLPDLTFTASQSLPSGPISGGNATQLAAMLQGLSIPPASSFELRVSFVPSENGAPASSDVFVNEFHYDNDGSDAGEFVEIAVGPGYVGTLEGVSLVLYNGSNGQSLATHTLDTFAAGAITTSGHRLFSKLISGIQNDMEGMAVVVGGNVTHFISYEGSFTAANGPAAGMTSEDIVVSQQITEAAGVSALGLVGNGGSSGNFTWTKFADTIPHSPGQSNNSQTFVNSNAPPQGLGFDNLTVEFLTDNDLDGLPDITDPDDDNDGQSDFNEVAFGTDPLDRASRFSPVIARNGSGLELSFPGAVGIHYTVECSETLVEWEELTTVTGDGQPVVVPLPMAEPTLFFRLQAGGP
jgi:endonuclease/exonuclease/phosphatase family metal-dependent hydrolase